MADTLEKQRNDLMVEIRNIAAKAETEDREFTEVEQTQVRDLMGKAKDLQKSITGQKVSKAMADDVRQFLSAEDAEALNADATAGARPAHRRIKSIGEYFTDSDAFKKSLGQYQGKSIPTNTRIATEAVQVPGGLKALIGTGDVGGSGANNLWDPQRIPTVQATWPQLKLRNVITVGETSSDAVTYARVLRAGTTGTVNNAAGVPEATSAAAVGSGTPAVTPVQAGVKPQSALAFEKVTAPVVTIAHWVPATKKALSDAGQLRTLIDNFLRAGLEQEIERQILGGDSTEGEEVDGLINTDGIQVQTFDQNILVTLRKALTKVRKYGTPNAILVSPETAERIDLLADKNGRPLGGGAFGAANPSVWRTPLVEVPGLDADTVLLGDFSTAVLWDREDASVTATDSHADFFVRNLVAILAEARAAFGVLDPALLVKVSVAGEDVIVPEAGA